MNKTGIEYLDFTWNPIHGCTRGCPYCWARKMAKRLAAMGVEGYDPADPFKPTVHYDRLKEPGFPSKPARVGVGFMGDLFDPAIPDHWIEVVIETCRAAQQHTFLFLTKNPERLKDFNPWPKNCWIGASATGEQTFGHALRCLGEVRASVRYISVEPMLNRVLPGDLKGRLEWLIIGGCTRPEVAPNPKWIISLTDYAARAGIPVFIKPNAQFASEPPQEFPND